LVALVSTIFAKEDTTNEAVLLNYGLDHDWSINVNSSLENICLTCKKYWMTKQNIYKKILALQKNILG
jgi:hypothetical protein